MKYKMPSPPVAKKVPYLVEAHNDKRDDPYFWMRDMDRKDPEVIAHLEAENAYVDEVMRDTEGLQQELFDEIIGKIKQQDESVPYEYDGHWYYTRYEEGKEYPVYCRRKGVMEATEQVMLDVNEMAAGYDYYQVVGNSISTNNQLLAFGEDTLSRRVYTIRFKDLRTGEYLEDRIENTTGGCVWANDNKTVFYTRKEDVTLRPYKVFRHVLGTDPSTDVEVYHETDPTFIVGVGKSKSKKYILVHSSATVSDEIRILHADNPLEDFRVFQPRQRHHEYAIAHFEDHFYILTNHKAKNFRLMKIREGYFGMEHWQEVIPHRKDVLLMDVDVFAEYLVLSERIEGLSMLKVINWISGEEHYIHFDEQAYNAYPGVNPNFHTTILRFGYTSMTTPSSLYHYNMDTRERILLKQTEVLGDFSPDNYHAERLWAIARDGARIPLSVVYRKGVDRNGDNPLLLYGYGSYGHTVEPYFSIPRLSLLDRGFIFVIAHIRGGQMLGRHWYEDGKLLKKKNTFTDFIDCAEFLIQERLTSPEKLFAMGGSAGGLLMGTVVNLRPDLWKGVIAAVPFVDVVTTMLDESIPLTTGEFDEWGNPKEEEFYWYMLDYSPYDNVQAKDYPNILVTTGLHDSQVQYWEPMKWVAKLRELKTDNNLLLFKTNMEFGHSGASGRFEVYKEVALEYAFLLKLLGYTEEGTPGQTAAEGARRAVKG